MSFELHQAGWCPGPQSRPLVLHSLPESLLSTLWPPRTVMLHTPCVLETLLSLVTAPKHKGSNAEDGECPESACFGRKSETSVFHQKEEKSHIQDAKVCGCRTVKRVCVTASV